MTAAPTSAPELSPKVTQSKLAAVLPLIRHAAAEPVATGADVNPIALTSINM